MLKDTYDSFKAEAEADIREMKDRHSYDIDAYSREIILLQEKLDDPTDKEIIRTVKRERDELRVKIH